MWLKTSCASPAFFIVPMAFWTTVLTRTLLVTGVLSAFVGLELRGFVIVDDWVHNLRIACIENSGTEDYSSRTSSCPPSGRASTPFILIYSLFCGNARLCEKLNLKVCSKSLHSNFKKKLDIRNLTRNFEMFFCE